MAVTWARGAAAHLLRRGGFGGTPSEIDELFALGLEAAVSRLVDYESISSRITKRASRQGTTTCSARPDSSNGSWTEWRSRLALSKRR